MTGGKYGLGMEDHAGRQRSVAPQLQTGDAEILNLHEYVSPHKTKTQLVTHTFACPVRNPVEVCRELELLTRSYFLPGVEFRAYAYLNYIHQDKGRLEDNEEYGCRDWISGRQMQPVVLERHQYHVLLLQEAISHWMNDASILDPKRRKLIAVAKKRPWSLHRDVGARLDQRVAEIFLQFAPSNRGAVIAALEAGGLPVVVSKARLLSVEMEGEILQLTGPYCDEGFVSPEFIKGFHERCVSDHAKFHRDPTRLLEQLQEAQQKKFLELQLRLRRPLSPPALEGKFSLGGHLEALRELQNLTPIITINASSQPVTRRRSESPSEVQKRIGRRLAQEFPAISKSINRKNRKPRRKKYEPEPTQDEQLRTRIYASDGGLPEEFRDKTRNLTERNAAAVRLATEIGQRLRYTSPAYYQTLRILEDRAVELEILARRGRSIENRPPTTRDEPIDSAGKRGPEASKVGEQTGEYRTHGLRLAAFDFTTVANFINKVGDFDQAVGKFLRQQEQIIGFD